MQAMQTKVEQEGQKADELFQKFQCYCQTSGGDLSASISSAETKVGELGPAIEAAKEKKVQLEKDIKSHQADREAAKTAMGEATSIREKEKAAFDKAHAESSANVAAIKKAVAALEKGMAGSFLQSKVATAVHALVEGRDSLLEADRQLVLSFLSGESQYAPASGEVVGILKQMGEEMDKDLQELIATEEAAVKSYEELMAAKKKEVAALSRSIEEKLSRVGEIGVEIAAMKNEAGDAAQALEDDKAFLADLEKNCDSKLKVHEEEKKMRAEEVVALADTIKVLNDDDALELFKKTLPGASSFLQVQRSSTALRQEAGAVIAAARARAAQSHAPGLDFIALALRGKKVGFEKVIKLIDELVESLKAEQVDDDNKKEYCGAQFDVSEDKKKELAHAASDLETVISEAKDGIQTATEDIAALEKGIAALDKAVAEATEQRKAENAEYKELMSSNGMAKELILFAKNRLNKYYNPALYKAPAKQELSEEDRIFVNNGGTPPPTEAPGGIANTGIGASLVQLASDVAPPPPPATAEAYRKQGEGSNGVIAMMDLLVKDLDKEMTVAESEEKAAQEEYERMMSDSAKKRADDAKSLTDREAAKAEMQTELEASTAEHKSTVQELMAVEKYIASLHAECDWLLQYHDVRKQARAEEADALQKAKAVLSGADYSLLQRASVARRNKFLHRQ